MVGPGTDLSHPPFFIKPLLLLFTFLGKLTEDSVCNKKECDRCSCVIARV